MGEEELLNVAPTEKRYKLIQHLAFCFILIHLAPTTYVLVTLVGRCRQEGARTVGVRRRRGRRTSFFGMSELPRASAEVTHL